MIDTYVGGGIGDGALAIDAVVDPRGIIVEGPAHAADLYIADGKQGRVRRVDGSSGLIETVAGNGEIGYGGDNGPARNARLTLPIDVARDAAGNLYISDYSDHRIRKVMPNGYISTLAGTGVRGYGGDGGLAIHATLHNPWGITVGPDGWVYVADHGNNRIRRIGPPGCGPQSCTINTVAGDGAWGFDGDRGPASAATLRNPADVAFDPDGNMVIADWGNHRIRRVVGGIIDTIAGGGTVGSSGSVGDGGPAVGAVLRYPSQVAVGPLGAVYIADTQQRRVRRVVNGIITTLAGTGTAGDAGDGGPGPNAEIYAPYGVAVVAGVVWIATTTDLPRSQHNRVRRVDANGIIDAVVGGGLGNAGAATDALVDPRGAEAVLHAGPLPDLYFADGANHVVRYVYGTDGTIYVVAGTGEPGYSGDGGLAINAQLRSPLDVARDGQGNLYISDSGNNVVRRVTPTGTISTVAGNGARGYGGDHGPATHAQLASPNGIAVGPDGSLYIADYNNNRIRRVRNGIIHTVAGNGNWGYGGDGGPATAATLRNPWDIAVGADGSLYIADTFNHRIRRVAPNGIISTYAGIGMSGFAGDGGPATVARIDTPALLALDGGGTLYFADRGNARVRRVIAQTGVIETVAGTGALGAGGDGGPATAASFSPPTGVAVDAGASTLFIAASDDYRVRMANLGGCAIAGTRDGGVAPAALLLLPVLLGAARWRRARRPSAARPAA